MSAPRYPSFTLAQRDIPALYPASISEALSPMSTLSLKDIENLLPAPKTMPSFGLRQRHVAMPKFEYAAHTRESLPAFLSWSGAKATGTDRLSARILREIYVIG